MAGWGRGLCRAAHSRRPPQEGPLPERRRPEWPSDAHGPSAAPSAAPAALRPPLPLPAGCTSGARASGPACRRRPAPLPQQRQAPAGVGWCGVADCISGCRAGRASQHPGSPSCLGSGSSRWLEQARALPRRDPWPRTRTTMAATFVELLSLAVSRSCAVTVPPGGVPGGEPAGGGIEPEGTHVPPTHTAVGGLGDRVAGGQQVWRRWRSSSHTCLSVPRCVPYLRRPAGQHRRLLSPPT